MKWVLGKIRNKTTRAVIHEKGTIAGMLGKFKNAN